MKMENKFIRCEYCKKPLRFRKKRRTGLCSACYLKMRGLEKKVKEKIRNDATIKIRTLLEVIENPKGFFKNKEKLLMVSIRKSTCEVSTAFDYSKKGKKDLIKFIKDELYL
jgi:hypothetical protein